MTLDDFEQLCERKRNGFKIPNHAIQGYGRMLTNLVRLARAAKTLSLAHGRFDWWNSKADHGATVAIAEAEYHAALEAIE